MWGTGQSAACRRPAARFIPTHVGNGGGGPESWRRLTVHPHACGERMLAPIGAVGSVGSSPRMWGTVIVLMLLGRMVRFIPTHVGNGLPSVASSSGSAVHPHACGERPSECIKPHYRRGSSPRMWGTELRTVGTHSADRFIPTHVGNGPNIYLR